MSELKPYSCVACETGKESKRLPKGWKDVPGSGPTCASCVSASWVSRAVRLQVKEVLGLVVGRELVSEDYRGRFFEPFLPAWRLSTDLANWAQAELLRHDTRREPGMTRLPPFAAINLYRRWNEVCPTVVRDAWDGSTSPAAAIIRAVETRWKSGRTAAGRNVRMAVLWHGEASASTFRFPHPVIVPGQVVQLAWQEHAGGRFPTASLLLPGTGRVLLRVDQGRDWRRNLRDFDAMVTGAAISGDVKVCGDMQNGRLSAVKLMVSGRFRRKPCEKTERTAIVRTGPNALVVVEVPDRDDCVFHREDLIGHVAAHERYREVRAVDLKYEKRWPVRQRRRFVRGGQAANTKYANRIDTITKQVAAATVGYCRRQRCDVIMYDDSDQTYIRGYRYHALRERLRQNCETNGIQFQLMEVEEVGSGAE